MRDFKSRAQLVPFDAVRPTLRSTAWPPRVVQVCVSWQKEGVCKKFDTMGKCAFDHPPQQVTDPFEKRAMMLVCATSPTSNGWIEPISPASSMKETIDKTASTPTDRDQTELSASVLWLACVLHPCLYSLLFE